MLGINARRYWGSVNTIIIKEKDKYTSVKMATVERLIVFFQPESEVTL